MIYSSNEKCPPGASLSKIAPHPDVEASFKKKLQFGLCIGLNESSILITYHKMSIFPACETFIFLSKLPLAKLSARILSRFNEGVLVILQISVDLTKDHLKAI